MMSEISAQNLALKFPAVAEKTANKSRGLLFMPHPEHLKYRKTIGLPRLRPAPMRELKAKFHYASWFGAGSKLVRSQISITLAGSNQLRTSSELASEMEFGFYSAPQTS